MVRQAMDFVTAFDPELGRMIEAEYKRQARNIELIASENIVSEAVMAAMGSVLTNKYAEGYPGKRYYGGCECVDEVENLAIRRVCQLFGAKYANVQPHSGAQANMAVYQALCKPGDTVLGMSLDNGGHLTHGSPVNQSGLLYNIVPYGVDENGLIDYDALRALAKKEQPKMIIAGASAYARTIDFKNTVIIMTSNIGTRQLKEFGRGVGFAAQARTDDNEHSRSVIQKALNKTFAPEFLNRLDEIITFDQLSLDAITKIVDIELKGLYGRVEAIGYKMVVDDEAKRFLATKGYDVQFGARPLKRYLQKYVETLAARKILSGDVHAGDTLVLDVQNGEFIVTVKDGN